MKKKGAKKKKQTKKERKKDIPLTINVVMAPEVVLCQLIQLVL